MTCITLQLLGLLIGNAIATTGPPGSQCEGLTCAGACNVLGCGQTCRCTSQCNIFCPNGNCLACCSCYKESDLGVGDVIAAKFDNSVYVVNRTQVPDDISNMDVLHTELAKVNQTWWQVDGEGSFYELPQTLVSREKCGSACFSCQLQCGAAGGSLGCFSSCACSQSSAGCSVHCSLTECLATCSCNKT
jgi:hypothetical protein